MSVTGPYVAEKSTLARHSLDPPDLVRTWLLKLTVCPVCQKLAAKLARLEEMTPKVPAPRRGLLAELMLVTRGVPRPRDGLLEDLRRATRGQARDAEVDHDHDRTGDGGVDRAAVVEEAPEPLRARASPAPAPEGESNLDYRRIPTIAATTDASPAGDRGVDLWTPDASEPLRTAFCRLFFVRRGAR